MAKSVLTNAHIFRITLIEEELGTAPNNEEIYRDYIASKAPDASTVEDEVAAIGVDAVEEKGITVFPKMADGRPFAYDYWVKGFFKSAAKAMAKVPGSRTSKMRAYIKEIDTLINVSPRQIPFNMNGMMMNFCERPLRASTPQGERVSLAKSETVPDGSTLTFIVEPQIEGDIDYLHEWFNYGLVAGLGQWRNSGKGKFFWEEIDRNGNVLAGNRDEYEARDAEIEEILSKLA